MISQEQLEHSFSYSYAMSTVREYLDNQVMTSALLRLYEWAGRDDHYDSKRIQLQTILKQHNLLDEIAMRIITVVAGMGKPNLNTIIGCVSPWLEKRINDDHPRTMKRVGEVTAILCEADVLNAELVDVPNEPREDDDYEDDFYTKGTHEEILVSLNNIELPLEVKVQLSAVGYIPCMFEAPNKVKHMHDSPYVIHQSESLVNSRAEPNLPINAEALNLVAGIRYKLAQDFMDTVTFESKNKHHALATMAAIDLIGDQEFFLPAYFDTRSRQYARGWQINYQGDDAHKSMISFADELALTL